MRLTKGTISISELWKVPGITIEITEELSYEDIPQGLYVFVNKSEYGYELYRDKKSYTLEYYNEDAILNTYFSDNLDRVTFLIEATSSTILGLIQDDTFDLTVYYDKLENYIKLKTILENQNIKEQK